MGQLMALLLKKEDVQHTFITDMPYPVLKRILQYVYSSGGSAALPCRLVSHAFNDAMVMNIQLHLTYKIRSDPQRCRGCLVGETGRDRCVYTDHLVNSRMVERISTVVIGVPVGETDDNWDQQDLIKLASELSRPVEVFLHAPQVCPPSVPYAPEPFELPILPMAQMSQMRVVSIARPPGSEYDLTQAELNFIASLQHLRELEMSCENLIQLSSHIDRSKTSQLHIDSESNRWDQVGRLYFNVTKLEVSSDQVDLRFLRTFTQLRVLQLSPAFNIDPSTSRLTGVRLSNLVQLDIGIDEDETDNYKLWLTSMPSVMPKLKILSLSLSLHNLNGYPVPYAQRIFTTAVISAIQLCPPTVEEFHLFLSGENDAIVNLSRSKGRRFLNALFTAVLNSRLTQVSFKTFLKPIGPGLDAMPFQFQKSRNGVQVGEPVKTWQKDFYRWLPVHKYQLQKRNGQICALDVVYNRWFGY